jgi:hypothetical protein
MSKATNMFSPELRERAGKRNADPLLPFLT